MPSDNRLCLFALSLSFCEFFTIIVTLGPASLNISSVIMAMLQQSSLSHGKAVASSAHAGLNVV
jgi:hypothetical protein